MFSAKILQFDFLILQFKVVQTTMEKEYKFSSKIFFFYSFSKTTYGKLLFRDTTSLTGMAISLWFSFTSRPRSTNVNPTITRVACPPQNFSSSPYSCRRPLVSHLLKRKLGQLVDFFMSGPLRCQRPNFKRGYPNPFLQKPKSALIYS